MVSSCRSRNDVLGELGVSTLLKREFESPIYGPCR